MRAPNRLIVAVVALASIAASRAPGQDSKPTGAPNTAKPTKSPKSKKATKAPVIATFEAHNEGSVEGAIYGDENLVSVTIDAAGIRYQAKGADKPVVMVWDAISDWQPNNFTSYSPGRAGAGDYGIGVHMGGKYLSFRTRNGRDYAAALKALRAQAPSKERPGIG
jgi:hypothetical protein